MAWLFLRAMSSTYDNATNVHFLFYFIWPYSLIGYVNSTLSVVIYPVTKRLFYHLELDSGTGFTVCSNKTFLIPLDLVFTSYEFKATSPFSLSQEIQLFSPLPCVSLISFGSPFRFEFNVPMQVIFLSYSHSTREMNV